MARTPLPTRRSIRWWTVAALVSLVAALTSPLPANAADDDDGVRTVPLAEDDPNSVEGSPNDPGDDFRGLDAGAASASAEATVDKAGSSPISPNYDPANDSRGDEPGRASAASEVPEQVFPDGEVLGDVEAIRAALVGTAERGADATARVIVTTRPPVGTSSNDMQARVDRLPSLEAALEGTGSRVVSKGQVVPVMTIDVTSAGLDALLAAEATGSVELDVAVPAALASALPVTGADVTDIQQLRGGSDSAANRWEVAILDTGVRSSHQAFGGRVVDEACYNTDFSCPNGSNSQTGPGAGASNGIDHGTHVAGISAASEVGSESGGVAHEVGIVAVNIFDVNGSAFNSSTISGIDFVAARELAGAKVASINLSIGTTTTFTSNCDFFSPGMVTSIAAARNQGILVVFAAGNSFSTTGVSAPSCLTGSTTISNSTDSDQASASTNINATLAHLWAPGTNVRSTIDASDTAYGSKTGTSMAAPHVAGAVAALADCFGWNTPTSGSYAAMDDDIRALMIATGDPVTDNRIGGTVTLPRLNLLEAADGFNNNNDFSGSEALVGNSGTNADYSHCATEEAGEPNNDGVASTWYHWTAPADGDLELTTCDAFTTADTLIHVYTGSAVNALTELASNDDDANCTESVLHSTTSLAVTSGTTYRVRVSVFGNTAHANGKYNVNWSFTTTTATCNGLTATIVGTSAGELINGTPGADVIVAGDGADTVNGLGGNDTICLGNGNDIASGGPGNDWISSGPGNDTVNGDDGQDFIRGASGDDTLEGDGDADQIFGDNGHDILRGGEGNDFLSSHGGADQEFGGAGNDEIFGGPGIDRQWGGPGNDIMGGHGHNDLMYGEDGEDIMSGHIGDDRMWGGDDRDRMYAGPDNDIVHGEAGPDTLLGHGGDDTLFGGSGADYMAGGNDTDVCNGGPDIDGAHPTCESTPNVP